MEGGAILDLVGEEAEGGGIEEVAAGPACGPVAHVDGEAQVVPAGEEFQAWQFRFPLGAE